ncbi:hypothetical protein ACSBR2_003984 [Camellia fascicularis]
MGQEFTCSRTSSQAKLKSSTNLGTAPCSITTRLPFENLSQLVRFDGASCGLFGAIPAEISKLQNLDTMFLQVNAFAGALTTELGYLKSLKAMDMSNNMFSGEIPASFAQLKNLTLLDLFRNELHGSIPEFTGNL